MAKKKCARIIATCFKPKRIQEETLLTGSPPGYYFHSQNFTNEDEIIDLIKFNIEIEKKITSDFERDLIIVNSDIGAKKGNSFIESINNTQIQNGKILTMNRKNIGLSFGAYSDAFKKYRNDYEYFILSEDDLSITENNYPKKSIEIFENSPGIGFLAFVGKSKIAKHHWNDLKITNRKEAYTCHGACGLSSALVLGEVFDKYGMLPHNQTNDYLDGITYGEVALPLAITRLGYRLDDQPKDMYLAVPSYDLMRGREIIKFPTLTNKIKFYTKNLLYKIFTSNKYLEKFYFFILKKIKSLSVNS